MAWIKAYKGFNKDMTCRDFQYEEGKEYTTDNAELCKSGFHACEYPLDCLSYYEPSKSEYHNVELDSTDEKHEEDTKRVGKRIKIGAKLSIKNLVEASIEYNNEHINKNNRNSATGDGSANSATGYRSANSATGDRSANSVTGYRSANSATGDRSANSATGYRSANSATGDRSANSATGDRSANSATGYGSANSATGDGSANSATGDGSANSATGDRSANSATGYRSANSATGDRSANSATGDGSANSATGYRSANSATGDGSANSATGYGSANVTTGVNSSNKGSEGTINVGWCKNNRCKGDIGAYIVLAECGEWDGEKYPILNAKMGKIDGIELKPDTWYVLRNGNFVEAEGQED